MPYEPIVPEGHHLGTSHEVDGAVTGHLFEDGTNELKGHAAWQWVDEPDDDDDFSTANDHEPPRELTPEEIERAAEIAALILAGIVAAVIVATPHVKRWWNEKAVPTAKTAWKRVAAHRKPKEGMAAATSSSVSRPVFVASATGVEVAMAESKVSMNGAEWALRFRAMLAAGAFKEEQWRILSNARIDDEYSVVGAQSTTNQLTPQQFTERIKQMLEANPSLLEEETSTELVRVFSARSTSSIDPSR